MCSRIQPGNQTPRLTFPGHLYIGLVVFLVELYHDVRSQKTRMSDSDAYYILIVVINIRSQKYSKCIHLLISVKVAR